VNIQLDQTNKQLAFEEPSKQKRALGVDEISPQQRAQILTGTPVETVVDRARHHAPERPNEDPTVTVETLSSSTGDVVREASHHFPDPTPDDLTLPIESYGPPTQGEPPTEKLATVVDETAQKRTEGRQPGYKPQHRIRPPDNRPLTQLRNAFTRRTNER
jgi:hypothetical protein